ncbi:MotA/TolQ/ExbB proton channel family protein [Nitrosococcus wardiae]|uniref:MotA/TolQ/ExbB proton channel family protein n=1 Tax=Nitrosococcus wardiae TaxID=1814290 RepID=A0A4P7BY12_9GAMM|nr:MotA/TolQ/ExbB proton channel family protein [Nitrosococcus wardiae]QBQ53342.1 MotA/TolQ/ExbB proton channel family protein [Nitrosococcus wardiae]
MLEIIKAGGWLMLPILVCSIVAIGIIIERFWSLRRQRVAPKHLVGQIWQWQCCNQLNELHIKRVRENSPLGRILAAGLVNRNHSREIMKESIEDVGRHVTLELERFLNTLGTIAAITPLLGLLGTVIGMIKVFTVINTQGVGNPAVLAGGISEALITTAAGLAVAIPSLMFYRYFRGKVMALVVDMEEQAIQLVEVMHGDRELDPVENAAA